MLCLGGVIFLSISGILGVYAISATFGSLFSSVSKKKPIDNDVFVS